MIRSLPDTNVFSKIFAGDSRLRDVIEASHAVIDTTIFIECIQGSKSDTEKRKIKKYLDNFPLLLITPEISQRAITLIDRYSNSFGLFLPDALIAATALENDLTIITYNIVDFKFIEGLSWESPSD